VRQRKRLRNTEGKLEEGGALRNERGEIRMEKAILEEWRKQFKIEHEERGERKQKSTERKWRRRWKDTGKRETRRFFNTNSK
jgi:hypothetical protein